MPRTRPRPRRSTRTATSLRWIPDNAAIYSTSLRNREKFEAIAKSQAWAKLRELPAVKMAWQMYETQAASPESGPGKVQAALEDPQVQDLMALLADMVSDEIFVYGDADMVDFFGLMQEVGGAMRYGPALVELSGRKKDLSKDDIQAMILLGVLSDNVDAVKVPGMVLGFKLEDKSRAVLNLGKLELIAGFALKQNPRFAECLKRTKIGGSEYLVLTLKGDMVPWDQLPLERFRRLETEPGSVDKLVAKLKKESLVVAVGLREDYLLLAVGSSTDVLARLGQGTSLAERPEMAPLAKFADKRIASIGYVSKALAQAANGNEQNIDDLLEFAEQALPRAGLTDEQQAQIRKDALALAADIKQILPDPGAMMSVAFLTDRGVEGYTYDWGTQPGLVAGQPLGLLEHVGGSPILAVVSRSKVSIDHYDGFVRWLGVGYGYFEKYGLPQMKESDRENFHQVAELVSPDSRTAQRDQPRVVPSRPGRARRPGHRRQAHEQAVHQDPARDRRSHADGRARDRAGRQGPRPDAPGAGRVLGDRPRGVGRGREDRSQGCRCATARAGDGRHR